MKTFLLSSGLLLPLLGLSASALSAPSTPSTPTLQDGGAPAPGTYEVDNVHSSVVFRILHNRVANFYGRFNKIEGSLTWDGEDLSKAKVSISIPVGSVDTNDTKRDDHLRSPDFFHERQFPKMTFVSSKIAGTAKELKVTGKLSVHGVEKEITVPAKFTGFAETQFGDRAGFEVQFKIDRTEFGMEAYPDNLGKAVDITVALETVKK